jgi:hypothetical protein
MPPPMRLSRDLLVRGITYKLQEWAYGGLSTAAARKLERAATGPAEPRRGQTHAADLAEAGHAVRAGVARGHPSGPHPCRRHRVARPALSFPLPGRAKDHGRSLVRPATLWPQAAAAGLYFNRENRPWPCFCNPIADPPIVHRAFRVGRTCGTGRDHAAFRAVIDRR